MKLKTLAGAACVSLSMATASMAATLVNQTLTGADLGAQATFSVAPTISGSSVTAGVPSQNGQIFSLGVLGAGARGDIDVTLSISYEANSSDSDFMVGVTDGINVISFGRIDANAAFAGQHALGGSNIFSNSLSGSFPVTGAGTITSFTNTFSIADGVAGATGSITEGASTANFSFLQSLDTDSALSIVAFGNAPSELYRIDSLSVLITDSSVAAIPLPASLPLLLVGLGAIGLARRRSN